MNKILLCLALISFCAASVSGINCYYCGSTSSCPLPFYPSSPAVSSVRSPTGYCAKKSRSSMPGALATRGSAEPGLCWRSGCFSTYDTSGAYLYVCCCKSSYCNTGNTTTKSAIGVLLGALALLFFSRST